MNAEQQLLEAWDRGRAATGPATVVRALLALTDTAEAFATLPLGAAHAALLRLRRDLFGPRLVCLTECPTCDERLELDLAVSDLIAGGAEAPPAVLTAAAAGERATFRLPTWADLAAVAATSEAGAPAADPVTGLLRRCVLSVEREGVDQGEPHGSREGPAADADRRQSAGDLATRTNGWSAELTAAVAAAMEEADPLAEIRFAVACPHCASSFEARLDSPAFLWAELDARAHRLLAEVDALAGAYGWAEADILALSPTRREVYLALVAGRR